MSRNPTSRAEVAGHRFLTRRLVHGVIRADTRMLHDPLRMQSRALAAGAVIAVLAVAGTAVFALFRPSPRIEDGDLVSVTETGMLHVVLGGRAHPVPNLASARLLLGSPAEPRRVPAAAIDAVPRGPVLGIPGGPGALTVDDAAAEGAGATGPGWTVCEDSRDGTTTVVAGVLPAPGTAPGSGERAGAAVLVRRDGVDWLLRDGTRARVDSSPAVAQAMGWGGGVPRDAGTVLLDALPEVPAVAAPVVEGAGDRAQHGPGGAAVGDVAVVSGRGDARHWLVLRDGVAGIGPAVADLVIAGGGARMVEVSAGELGRVPVVAGPDLGHIPASRPTLSEDPVVCASWWPAGDGAGTAVYTGARTPLPEGAAPVALAGADGTGPRVDAYWQRPGTVRAARAAALAGGPRAGARWLVADTGTRFAVPDDESATALGVGAGVPAPWPVLAALPAGPVLGRAESRVGHDDGGRAALADQASGASASGVR